MSIDDIIDEVEVCPECGAPYVGTSCPNCGHRTKDAFDEECSAAYTQMFKRWVSHIKT